MHPSTCIISISHNKFNCKIVNIIRRTSLSPCLSLYINASILFRSALSECFTTVIRGFFAYLCMHISLPVQSLSAPVAEAHKFPIQCALASGANIIAGFFKQALINDQLRHCSRRAVIDGFRYFLQQKSQSTGFPISGGHTVCPSSFTIFTNSSIGISRTLLIRQTNVAEGFSFVPRSRSRMYRSELSQSSASRICDSRFCFLAARSLLESNLASMPFTHFHAESIKEV